MQLVRERSSSRLNSLSHCGLAVGQKSGNSARELSSFKKKLFCLKVQAME